MPIRRISVAELTYNAIKVEDEQILMLQASSSLKQDSSRAVVRFPCSWLEMLLGAALLIKLDLSPSKLHLLLTRLVSSAVFLLDSLALLSLGWLRLIHEAFSSGIERSRVKLRVLHGLSGFKLRLLDINRCERRWHRR